MLTAVEALFGLENLRGAIIDYLNLHRPTSSSTLNTLPPYYEYLDIWFHMRVLVEAPNKSYNDEWRSIRAIPALEEKPSRFDPFFATKSGLDEDPSNNIHGELISILLEGFTVSHCPFVDMRIGQLRLIFRASSFGNASHPLLLYMDLFTSIPPRPSPLSKLFAVGKVFHPGPSKRRASEVASLLSVIRPCPLVPVILGAADGAANADNCLDRFDRFYINQFDNHVDYQFLRLNN